MKYPIDINKTDDFKRKMNFSKSFGSEIQTPLSNLILKTEEPGTKAAMAMDQCRPIAFDLINHLCNDIACGGGTPRWIENCIMVSDCDNELLMATVDNLREAAKNNGAVITGGETSIQPGVVPDGRMFISAFGIGTADIPFNDVKVGDGIWALPSNGPMTNGYSLIRQLPLEFQERDDIMAPHPSFIRQIKEMPTTSGLAHITGGGLFDNIARIMPRDVAYVIDFGEIRVLPIFDEIREMTNMSFDDMYRTFNMGVGLAIVSPTCPHKDAYQIGEVIDGPNS